VRAASHLALGFGLPELRPETERHRINGSGESFDLTIGSNEVEVSGVTPSGETVPLLRTGRWVGGTAAR
jgi:leucyl aminopeptidase (aminopeptidase T)